MWALVRMSDNNIGDEGAKALGPHLAKLNNMTHVYLSGVYCHWRIALQFVETARCDVTTSTCDMVVNVRCQATRLALKAPRH